MKQELAKEYTKKLADLFVELLQSEKESKLEDRDATYAHSQVRIERLLRNYEKKFDELHEQVN